MGVVRDHSIILERGSGLPDGQRVTVQVQPAVSTLPPGEGLKRAFGAWADDAQALEQFLESNRLNRKHSKPEIET